MSGETRALDGFYEALYTERTKCKVSRRFRDENAQKVLPPQLSRLQANKSLISTSDLNFDSSLLPFSPLLLPRKINHEEEVEEEEASDQRRSKVEDVEEKETKRKERNAEEIARSGNGNRNRNSGDIGLPLICQFDRRYNAQKEAARVGNGR